MSSIEFSEGISETLDILKYMEKSYIDKIPKKFKEFLEKNKSKDYIPSLDHRKKLNELYLKNETKNILAIIYMNYWCTPEEKNNYVKILQTNEIKYQEKLKEKYNTDNLFKNKETKIEIVNNSVAMVEYQKSFFTKFIKKLKSIFHIK